MARRLSIPDEHTVPRWFWPAASEHRLKPAEIVVFCALCSLRDETAVIAAPLRLIAEQSTIARSAVAKAMDELTRRTFIVDLGTPAPRRPRRYRIADSRPLPPQVLENPTRRATRDGSGWLAVL